MSEAARRSIVRVPLIVAAGSRFDKYKPEQEREVRKAEVKEDKALEQLRAAWRNFGYEEGRKDWEKTNYKIALEQVKGISCSAKDIENFCIALAEFQDEMRFPHKAGYLLSALINNGKDSDYVIHVQHLSQAIWWVGYENTKNIVVNGDVGYSVGQYMKGGLITVNGNAGSQVGTTMEGGTIAVNGNAGWHVGSVMKGGTIVVDGNVGDEVGFGMEGGTIVVNGNAGRRIGEIMRGGTITVKGNAGNDVGDFMRNGEIHMEGDYKGLSKIIEGGKIYHKGVLIVDK